MDYYDESEVCELIGTYLLNQLQVVITKENVGLYRDSRLGIFKNMPGNKEEKRKKELLKISKSNGVTTTVKVNVKQPPFLTSILI